MLPGFFIYITVQWGVVVLIQSGSSTTIPLVHISKVFHLYHCSLGVWSSRFNRGIVTTTIPRFIFPRLFSVFISLFIGALMVVLIQSGSSRLQYPGTYVPGFHLYHCSMGRVVSRFNPGSSRQQYSGSYFQRLFSFISLFIGACGRPDKMTYIFGFVEVFAWADSLAIKNLKHITE